MAEMYEKFHTFQLTVSCTLHEAQYLVKLLLSDIPIDSQSGETVAADTSRVRGVIRKLSLSLNHNALQEHKIVQILAENAVS